MTHIRLTIEAFLLSAILATAGISAIGLASAQAPGSNSTSTSSSMMMDSAMNEDWMKGANKKVGWISSIQNDEGGEPAWIVAGFWVMEFGGDNATSTAANITTPATGNTTTASSVAANYSNVADFNAMVHMIMLDGNAPHQHRISNFTQEGAAATDTENNSTTITGTITITMRGTPVNDVPVEITIFNNRTIAIEPDASAVEDHFGDTPIYGLVMTPEMNQMMGGMMGQRTSTAGNMTGSMMEQRQGNSTGPPVTGP